MQKKVLSEIDLYFGQIEMPKDFETLNFKPSVKRFQQVNENNPLSVVPFLG